MICLKCGQNSPGNYCSNCGAQLFDENQSLSSDFEDLDNQKLDYDEDEDLANDFTAPQPERRTGSERENRGVSRKRGKPKRETVKRETAKRQTGSRGTSDKLIKKELKQRDSRIRRLEDEVEEFNRDQRKRSRIERREQGPEENTGKELREAAVKGVVGMTVLCSRIMQLVSFFLMAYMVWILQRKFLSDGESLGNIYTMLEERNYALALYAAIACVVLLFAVIWCLWILSKKDAGGNTRLKKYDTGRGFMPFLICAAACALVPLALAQLPAPEQITGFPEISVSVETWQALERGARMALTVIDSQRGTLIFVSLLGAVLSFARKILRV